MAYQPPFGDRIFPLRPFTVTLSKHRIKTFER